MTDIQTLLERADKALTAQFVTARQMECYLLMPDMVDALKEFDEAKSGMDYAIKVTMDEAETLRTRLEAAEIYIEALEDLREKCDSGPKFGAIAWSAAMKAAQERETWRKLRDEGKS